MAMKATLTLAGMLNYKPDLFDEMQLPTPPTNAGAIGLQNDQLRAAWTIDRDDLAEFIALHTAGMTLCYPDANFMKHIIGTWSKAHITEWQRLFDTLFYKYNAMWNKDGKIAENGLDTNNQSVQEYSAGTGSYNSKGTGYTHGYDGGTVHTDDGLAWSHAEKAVDQNSSTSSGNRTNTTTGTLNRAITRSETGNIGVTMTQELIAKEREIAMFSIDEYIADEFKHQFCLMLW